MATTDFSKINWGDYQNWEQVATPSGEMFYLVPGTGWAYNPFMSAQTGRVQLFPNPKLALQKQAEQEAEIEKAKKDAEKKSGLGYQLLQTAMPAAVALGTKYAYDKWLDPNAVTKEVSKTATSEAGKSWLDSMRESFFGTSSTPGATSVANNVSTAPSGITGANYLDTTMPIPGGENIATSGTGEVASSWMPEMSASNVLGAAATAKGVYDTYNSLDNGGKGIRTSLAETGAGIGTMIGGPVGGAIGAAAGSWAGYGLQNQSNWKGFLSPVGILNAHANLFGVKLLHKSTKQEEQEKWGELADKGVTGAKEAFMAAHSDPAGTWQDGAEKGKEWNWEDAKNRAQINPSEFRGVYGNFDTFGNDWATYDPAQQDEIVKRLLAESLYNPEKGDITIADKTRARQIKDEVLSNDPATSMLNNVQVKAPEQNIENVNVQNPGVVAGIPGAQMTLAGTPVNLKTASPYQSLTGVDPVDIGKKLADRLNMWI